MWVTTDLTGWVETKAEFAASKKSSKVKAILGSPWLSKVKALTNYSHRIFWFSNLRRERYTIWFEKNKKPVKTLESIQDTIIRKFSEMNNTLP
jgi:hypothetical protein